MPLKNTDFKSIPLFTPKIEESPEITYTVWDQNYDWTIHLSEDIDIWKATFGEQLSAICEFCNEKIVYKNKSHYNFRKKDENPRLLLQCCECDELFGKKKKHVISTKDEDNILQPIINIHNIDECSYKLPKRVYCWKKLHKRNQDSKCAICDILLTKKSCLAWYKKLPSEGGQQNFDNFSLVCDPCQYNMYKKKKGIESYKKRYCKSLLEN
jgi:hypothetical protein